MGSIEHTLSDAVSWMVNFLVHTLAPWAWENKFWIAVFIPLIVVLAVVKWIWD
jgi:hypothetical protein